MSIYIDKNIIISIIALTLFLCKPGGNDKDENIFPKTVYVSEDLVGIVEATDDPRSPSYVRKMTYEEFVATKDDFLKNWHVLINDYKNYGAAKRALENRLKLYEEYEYDYKHDFGEGVYNQELLQLKLSIKTLEDLPSYINSD